MSLPPSKPFHPSLQKAHRTILHLLLARPSSPPLNLTTLSHFMSSASGLDKSLMVIQYPAKIIVALLVALAARLARSSNGGKMGAVTSLRWAARFKALSSSIGDARTMMRLLGIIPVLASLPAVFSAHADPTTSLINIAQTVSLLIYYPLENTSYLSSKGVIPLSPHREAAWSTWSCRYWAAYVVLDVWRLARQRGEMQRKGRAVRMRMDGGEKDVGADVEALRREKVGWMEEVVVNVGYAPLTIHWSLPNGAWSNEASAFSHPSGFPLTFTLQVWTGVFGTIACLAGIRAKWRNMSP
ncbi:hypothetical protein QFC20_002731 [Naganishia adeliensis]|uniref:Uncharacterized protein n=1 Tax=Naganishia adeliensis TaxID=92952 RepID=A0ACC2WGP9_9TREE|nr:hypothetical protein QFC20_002731 [Naganishia adeliensis]